jgi:hypothetical protein
MHVALEHQIKSPDYEWPCDGDRLERLGWKMGLQRIVLAPFVGAYDLLNVGHGGQPVEALRNAFLTRVLGVAWCP